MSKEEWLEPYETDTDKKADTRQHVETNASNSNVQRELDHRLLEMCNGQLRALATTVNRLTATVLIAGIVCTGLLLWSFQTQNMHRDALFERISRLEENQAAEIKDVIQSARYAEKSAERASKHVWELKQALSLKFSQQRSAEKAHNKNGEK